MQWLTSYLVVINVIGNIYDTADLLHSRVRNLLEGDSSLSPQSLYQCGLVLKALADLLPPDGVEGMGVVEISAVLPPLRGAAAEQPEGHPLCTTVQDDELGAAGAAVPEG